MISIFVAMNKLIRNLLRDKHYRRRSKLRKSLTGTEGGHCYRDQATPCSCMFCDPHKHGNERFSHRRRNNEEDAD